MQAPGQFQPSSGEGSEGSGEALVQSQVRFNRVSEKVLKKVWEALVQSQVRFNRVSEEVGDQVLLVQSQVKLRRRGPEKVWEALVQPGQVQQGSGEGSGEGLGGFGAKPGQVQ